MLITSMSALPRTHGSAPQSAHGDDVSRAQVENFPSLDRIDNSKGYVPGNIAVISMRANMIKNNATLAELKAIVAYIEASQSQ